MAKVTGVYKHSIIDEPGSTDEIIAANPQAAPSYYSLSGESLRFPAKGINIVRQPDGTAKKVLINQ